MRPTPHFVRVAFSAAAVLASLLAPHELAAGPPRIGILGWADCDSPDFVRGLAELGRRPGETITLECRTSGESYRGFAGAATDLVGLGVDVIVAFSQPAGQAAHQVTSSVPIVTAFSGDPVAGGLARSLAKPGGNVTGVSYYATELTAKRLELLKAVLPSPAVIHVLANPALSYLPFENDTKLAAARLGLEVRFHPVGSPTDIDRAFATMGPGHAEAVFALPDLMLAHEAPRIAALALQRRLPTMAWGDWFTDAGCLMSYSAPYRDIDHRLASYVDRILAGARPGDLPIEQPATFELSLNLRTAQALGLQLPPALLLLADRVIE